MRREFHLPEEDVEYLDARGLPWETIIFQGKQWLLIHEFPLCDGYTTPKTSVALFITPNYPVAQIDMCYFYPAALRADRRVIPATQATAVIDGKQWQRWSRHRTAQNPWRPGVDNVATHLALVEDWLERENRNRR